MTRIVRERYPADNLPDDLRRDLGDVLAVRVTLEPEADALSKVRNVLAQARRLRDSVGTAAISEREAVKRIRALRSE
jgi:hypothetical protein